MTAPVFSERLEMKISRRQAVWRRDAEKYPEDNP
jgi:hypothetical protein